MLKVQFKDKSREPVWIMEKSFAIGRANKNHLKIDDDSVAPQHARIQNQGEAFLLKDLGSEHGTFVNNRRITQKNIACGDTLRFGEVELEVIDPLESEQNNHAWSLIADASWLSGQEFPIIGEPGQAITIGRSAQCDIVFPGTHLSRAHAQITIGDGQLTIRDMGSANGTFVNDRKITEAQVHAGDRVRLDVYSFRVFGPGIELPKSATATIQAIPDIDTIEPVGPKRWKSKPTSPGNREELDLYKKHNQHLIIAGVVVTGVLAAFIYVILAVLGIIE